MPHPMTVPVPSPVEGIRIQGEIGPFLTAWQSSLSNFDVRVDPLGMEPRQRMGLVAETVAAGATRAVDAPDSVVQEKNVP
ncbi:MAG: hypothetical protein ACRDS9_13630 [Pseudonocardiaceae bacterium]